MPRKIISTEGRKIKKGDWYTNIHHPELNIVCENCDHRLGEHNGKTDQCPVYENGKRVEKKYLETTFK